VIKKPQRRKPRPALGCRAIGRMEDYYFVETNFTRRLFMDK
jgi:hypothetical protein